MKYLCSLFTISAGLPIIPSKYYYIDPQSTIIGNDCEPTLVRTDIALVALYILKICLLRVSEESVIFESM